MDSARSSSAGRGGSMARRRTRQPLVEAFARALEQRVRDPDRAAGRALVEPRGRIATRRARARLAPPQGEDRRRGGGHRLAGLSRRPTTMMRFLVRLVLVLVVLAHSSLPAPPISASTRMHEPFKGYAATEQFVEIPQRRWRRRPSASGWSTPASCAIAQTFRARAVAQRPCARAEGRRVSLRSAR